MNRGRSNGKNVDFRSNPSLGEGRCPVCRRGQNYSFRKAHRCFFTIHPLTSKKGLLIIDQKAVLRGSGLTGLRGKNLVMMG